MSFPAEAFTSLDGTQTEIGTFALPRGNLVFRCQFDPEGGPRHRLLWLTGEHAGKLSEVPNEVFLAIAPEYSIQIRISSLAQLSCEYQPKAGVIEIVSGGVELWGAMFGAPHHVYAFDLTGRHSKLGERQGPMMTFASYECWLQKDGRTVGDTPLFTIPQK